LSGIRVIELGTLIRRPFAARIFAEFGADVIKMSSRQAIRCGNGGSPQRNVRSGVPAVPKQKVVALDLKSPDAVGIVRTWLRTPTSS